MWPLSDVHRIQQEQRRGERVYVYPPDFTLIMFAVFKGFVSDLQSKQMRRHNHHCQSWDADTPHATILWAIEWAAPLQIIHSKDTSYKAYRYVCSTSRHRTSISRHTYLLYCPSKSLQRNHLFYLQQETHQSFHPSETTAPKERCCIYHFIP